MPTPRAYYADLLDKIFGPGAARFDRTTQATNNVIGSLARTTDFFEFRRNFEARLRRLASAVTADPSLRSEVIAALNRIVEIGWDGAFAELAALDYFLVDPLTGPGNVMLDATAPATDTLGADLGMTHANHDLRFPQLGVSLDTKMLTDKTGDILDGIFKEFRKIKTIKSLVINPSYDPDDDYAPYAQGRQALLKELIDNVDVHARPPRLASRVIPGLSYEFMWNAGVSIGVGEYSPITHADHHHRLLFGHAKKFSRAEPTVLVMVTFPWAGERVLQFDRETTRLFFRTLGQRFFLDYLAKTEPARAFNSKFRTSISAADVTRHLSGLVFLEDQIVKGEEGSDLTISASYLWNPHAIHPLSGHAFERLLQGRGAHDLSQDASLNRG